MSLSPVSLPPPLSERFTLVRSLAEGRHSILQVRGADGTDRVAKLGPGPAADPELSALLAERAAAGAALLVPEETGKTADGRWYELLPFFPAGSLRDQTSPWRLSAGGETACRDFVRQVSETLEILHARDTASCFAFHGDIKPSNILLSYADDGNRYFLSDLESAILLRGSVAAARVRSFSIRHAPPEVLAGGDAGPAVDFWSLGMVVLEWLTGVNPLASFPDASVRRQVATSWRPDLGGITEAEWRALLGGLLERNPDTRWGISEVKRWQLGDPATISDGLALAGEAYARTPHFLGGIPVQTTRALASTLLDRWPIDALLDPALAAWLTDELRRPDLAALLAGLLQDEALDGDLRLLYFADTLDSRCPAMWRRFPLDAVQIEAVADAAMAGASDSMGWLQSLLEPSCHRFHAERHPEAAAAVERLRDGWEEYRRAWDSLVAQGVPEAARPAAEDSLPLLARALFSAAVESGLRAQVAPGLAPGQLFQRSPWYFSFGMDVASLAPAHLLILEHLEPASRLGPEHVRVTFNDLVGADPSRFRGASIHSRAMNSLLFDERTTMKPGTGMIMLQPGEGHYDGPRGTLAQTWDERVTALRGHLRAAWRWLRRTVLPRLGIAAPPTRQAVSAELRLFHLVQQGLALGREEREVFYAQLSWTAPPGTQVKVHISVIDGLLPYRSFSSPPLPDQATFHFPLTTNSRIWLTAGQPRRPGGQATDPMRVWFTSPPRLRMRLDRLRQAEPAAVRQADRLLSPRPVMTRQQEIRPLQGGIIPPDKRILDAETTLLSPDALLPVPLRPRWAYRRGLLARIFSMGGTRSRTATTEPDWSSGPSA